MRNTNLGSQPRVSPRLRCFGLFFIPQRLEIMSTHLKRIVIAITALLVFSGVLVSCTKAEQYTFFVTLGDRTAQTAEEPATLEDVAWRLEDAKARWKPETATPEQNAVLTELARQAQERAFYEGIIRSRQASPSLHPFLVCVRHHESDRGPYPHANGYYITNTHGDSTSSGAYQFVDGTWRTTSARAGYPGYARAYLAPAHVQDAVALWLYNNGGKSAWDGTGC